MIEVKVADRHDIDGISTKAGTAPRPARSTSLDALRAIPVHPVAHTVSHRARPAGVSISRQFSAWG